jgi:hypothetical protein
LFVMTGCVIYDETLVARGSASVPGGPSTVFGATGWNVGVGSIGGTTGQGGATAAGTGGSVGIGGASDGAVLDDASGTGGESGTGLDDGGHRPRPTGVTITSTAASRLVAPSTSGTGYFGSCERDAVVIGYVGTVNPPEVDVNYLRSFQAICASLVVTGTTSYAVATRRTETLAPVGDTRGTLVQTVLCPSDEIVVGFGVHSGSFIDSIAFSCAPLVVSSTLSGYSLSLGAKTTMSSIGGPRGMTFTQAECAPDAVAVGHTGKAGRDINSFGLLCGTPALVIE